MRRDWRGGAGDRAVLFDLDDTLYPQRRFVLSGFAVASRHLGVVAGRPTRELFRTLTGEFRRGQRGREFQSCLHRLGLPESTVATLVALVRAHDPRLRLPRATRDALEALRADWRIGVVTNGDPAIQARKIRALGVAPLVDEIVYAAEYGSGGGKPDPEPFEAALARLGVPPHRAVFVGDSEICDVQGATAVGLHTVRVSHSRAGGAPDTQADALVRSMREVPTVVARLVESDWSRDVA
ncbi:MAG: HAD family hydrolase [Vicinamibacterales bacterium]